ncbi:NAD-dependent epimerase/dehydratase family protein [Marinobacter salinisoli]|uniref:NAD-dependent epimerase/dehydratase family protein n=1 Tax=Marinobacter salinisoli TaxID=2769486 RepID=A0ABX7MSE9_9GAMM|nr:NAD-dependent epimerase/dehydratase family protein [Marinobacter salinisoli]QSP94319.1 NAD-dependent epimerase/dehydratase family protein [Marinobacter salinisoli]
MTEINRNAPVLVTGATGYVAGWLVKRLLDEGMTVHAAVRDPSASDKLQFLNRLAEQAPGEIRYFKADLLQDGSYAEAMEGCELVFHTASPFVLDVKDPQKELVDPALRGTRNVLEQANKTPSVKRVVVTSSVVAIYGDNVDLQSLPDGTLNESVWNTSSSVSHQPYAYSKTLAEKEAWKIAEGQKRWDLVTINPALVIGPGINPRATSESFNIVKQMGNGSSKPGAPRMGLGVVDVRDVAEAHFQAGFNPEASGRYIVSGHNTDLVELAGSLLDKYGDQYPIPRKALPKWLVWLVGPLVSKGTTRRMIARNVDLPWQADNSKGTRELGLSYRSMKESMEAMFQQMIDSGQLRKR